MRFSEFHELFPVSLIFPPERPGRPGPAVRGTVNSLPNTGKRPAHGLHLQRALPGGTQAALPHDPRGADGIYVRFNCDNLDIPVRSPGECRKSAVNSGRVENDKRLPARHPSVPRQPVRSRPSPRQKAWDRARQKPPCGPPRGAW